MSFYNGVIKFTMNSHVTLYTNPLQIIYVVILRIFVEMMCVKRPTSSTFKTNSMLFRSISQQLKPIFAPEVRLISQLRIKFCTFSTIRSLNGINSYVVLLIVLPNCFSSVLSPLGSRSIALMSFLFCQNLATYTHNLASTCRNVLSRTSFAEFT